MTRIKCVSFAFIFFTRCAQDMKMTKFFKLFHPHAQRHERRRQALSLSLVIGLGLVAAATVAGIFYWMYYGDRFRP